MVCGMLLHMATMASVVGACDARWAHNASCVGAGRTLHIAVCRSDGPLPRPVPPAADPVRDQQGKELHGGGGPVPGLHAAQARLRQGERLRRAATDRPPGAPVPLRLVHQVPYGHGECPPPGGWSGPHALLVRGCVEFAGRLFGVGVTCDGRVSVCRSSSGAPTPSSR